MGYKVVDVSKIIGELMEVLIKNEVPVAALDDIFDGLKKTACMRAYIK